MSGLTGRWMVDTLVIEDRAEDDGRLLGKAHVMRGSEVTLLTALIEGRKLRARVTRLENSLAYTPDGGIVVMTDWTRVSRRHSTLFDAYELRLDADRKHELMVLLHASLRHQDGRVPMDSTGGKTPSTWTVNLLAQAGWVFQYNGEIVVAHLQDYAVAVDPRTYREAARVFRLAQVGA